ncbi:MAG: hypothetical protein LDL50_02610 [Chloroflexi bacterium]|nr:hypothetical protein [Chloroflexota bacterium]
MKRKIFLLFIISIPALLALTACGGAAPAAPAAQAYAPAYQVSSSCSAPDVQDTIASDRYCVDKVPYQNILIDDGVTFEVLEPENLTCVDNGSMAKGKHVIECHGKPAWKTQVKFTNTACGGSNLQAGTDKCQEGMGYDAANNCCAPLSGGASTVITVNMGACAD